jgi:hypothetical protein
MGATDCKADVVSDFQGVFGVPPARALAVARNARGAFHLPDYFHACAIAEHLPARGIVRACGVISHSPTST